MKSNRPSRQLTKQIALASGLVMLFAGCQVAPPANQAQLDSERLGGKQAAKPTNAAQNGNTETAPTPDVEPDAKVTGTVTDTAGQPLANVDVNTYHGFSAKTDANGKFTIDAKAEEELRLDFGAAGYLDRQMFVGIVPGATPNVTVTLKKLDSAVTTINGAKGGTATSSDGKAILEIPAGALKGDTKVRLTWMNPLPSKEFPEPYGELPGPLVTRTLPDGSNQGENYEIPPIAFADVQLIGENLAPGAQATLRMKVNPAAMDLAQGKVDFNNPSTLQQPCYDFDRSSGTWVNPATSKLEKDANGDVWFVYTLRGSEAAPKYKTLNHVVDTKTVWYTRTYQETYWGYKPGGGWQWLTRTVSVRESYTYNIYGDHFGGRVVEQSANRQFDNNGVPNARVAHAANWYGGTNTNTGNNGGFDVPRGANAAGVQIYGVSWRGANWPKDQFISGRNGQINIDTDGNVRGNIRGGSAPYSATNSNLTSGTLAEGDVALNNVGRDTNFSVNKPADDGDPIYLVKDGVRNVTPSGTVPVKGTYNFGNIRVIRDLAVRILEESIGGWNANQPNKPTNGAGFSGVTLSNFADAVTGGTSGNTNGAGNFGFSLLSNANLPTLKAAYKNTGVGGDVTGTKAIDVNFTKTFNTDVKYTLNLVGNQPLGDEAGKDATIKYKVDGVTYTRPVSAATAYNMVFVRDAADDSLDFELLSWESPTMVAIGPFPKATLGTGGSGSGQVEIRFKEGAIK